MARAELVSGGPAVELPVTNNVFTGEVAAAIEGALPRVVFVLREEGEEDEAGGCSTGGTGGGIAGGLLAIGLLLACPRRR